MNNRQKETKKDLGNEQDIFENFTQFPDLYFKKTSYGCSYDRVGYDQLSGEAKGIFESKDRSRFEWDEFPTLVISANKIVEIMASSRILDLSAYLVVKYSGSKIRYIELTLEKSRRWLKKEFRRNEMRIDTDEEMCIYIPIAEFKEG